MRKLEIFLGAILVGMSSHAHAQAAAGVDREFQERHNIRTLNAAATDEGGYFVCPNDQAASAAFQAADGLSPARRDERFSGILASRGCRPGKGTIRGIVASRQAAGQDIYWYKISASEGGRPVIGVLWTY